MALKIRPRFERPPGTRSKPERIVLGVTAGATPSKKPPVRIFVGTEPGQHGPLGAGRIEIVGGLGNMPSLEEVRSAVGRIAS